MTISLFDLTGRTALVTGAAGLLGAEFCRILGEAGANVVVVDVNAEGATRVADALTLKGCRALAVAADLTAPEATAQMVESTLKAFGSLDILVNSAALDPKFDPAALAARENVSGAFETFPLAAWQQALDVNLTGMFLATQSAVKPMLKQGRGVIINICSMYGLTGPDQRLYQRGGEQTMFKPAYYSVTKAGVLGFTRYLAAYYAGKNIRVNALTPGGVFNGHNEEFLQQYAARSILGRMANKDEMNGALLFLASDASAYMTGANLVVDGGWTAW
ncbi:MAG: SDR family oxidoreductase [Anaerolineales bacterium]